MGHKAWVGQGITGYKALVCNHRDLDKSWPAAFAAQGWLQFRGGKPVRDRCVVSCCVVRIEGILGSFCVNFTPCHQWKRSDWPLCCWRSRVKRLPSHTSSFGGDHSAMVIGRFKFREKEETNTDICPDN